ncbi:hypothetical protein [Gordonibacter urolithinfaciens]|uniref:hypothetical protein n=1 Tax=Gordonibacter urolithinfaciens TaxID=1335613 RepID=UPI0034AFA1C4
MGNQEPTSARRAAGLAARVAVALVFALNVQCAVSFVLWPGAYAGGFELEGVPGAAAVRGLGVAFLMWNATYPAVIANPRRFRALYAVVLAQQAVGLAGESWILLSLPAGHAALAASIVRFIAFDAAGLVLMAAAFAWLALADRHARLR